MFYQLLINLCEFLLSCQNLAGEMSATVISKSSLPVETSTIDVTLSVWISSGKIFSLLLSFAHISFPLLHTSRKGTFFQTKMYQLIFFWFLQVNMSELIWANNSMLCHVWSGPRPFLYFSFLSFSSFFLRGHNTCIACRIFVYFSPLARKKGFCSAIGNLKLD